MHATGIPQELRTKQWAVPTGYSSGLPHRPRYRSVCPRRSVGRVPIAWLHTSHMDFVHAEILCNLEGSLFIEGPLEDH